MYKRKRPPLDVRIKRHERAQARAAVRLQRAPTTEAELDYDDDLALFDETCDNTHFDW